MSFSRRTATRLVPVQAQNGEIRNFLALTRQQSSLNVSAADDLANDHSGLRAHLPTRMLRAAALLALIPYLVAGKPVVSQQAICDEVQSYVNMFVDYTKTTCAPTGTSNNTFTFLVLSSEPIFSIRDEKKAWLIAVVLSLGNAMNGAPDVKTGELYVADADLKTNIAYVLPIVVANARPAVPRRAPCRGRLQRERESNREYPAGA